MTKRDKLEGKAISTFLAEHPEWKLEDGAVPKLSRAFAFSDYASGVAFAVRVAFAAEKRDHHPDLRILWGNVRVDWSTHDAGGITELDVEMAEATARLYKGD